MRAQTPLILLAAAFTLAACSSANIANPVPAPAAPQGIDRSQQGRQTASLGTSAAAAGAVSILRMLDDKKTVGSVVDSATGDVNPYGLDVAKVNSGKVRAGDLVVCDFNDKANVQGTGTAIVVIGSDVGSKPRHLVADNRLKGCDAIALAPDDTIWPADFTANNAPIVTTSGQIVTTEKNGPWHGPFGEAFVPPVGKYPPAFYVSNAGDGSLVRITLGQNITFTVIASGFPINGGQPGSILGPSGLNYDAARDRFYVVDGTNNALYAIDHVSQISANGIVVNGLSFSGPDAADAHVVYDGAPLNAPISSALLPGGHIALGNTLDPAGKNLMVELSPSGNVLDVKNVDTGAAGAIFGMVATGSSAESTKLYFNDDNDNTLKVLEP